MRAEQTEELVEKVFRFNKLLFQRMDKVMGSSHGEFKMLGVINKEMEALKEQGKDIPGVTVSKLSACLMHSKPATSKMLNTLEEKGYIERITTKADRRAVYIRLTESGQQRINRIKGQMDYFTNSFLEELGEEDTKGLIRILDHMYEVISSDWIERVCFNDTNEGTPQ